MKKTSVTLMLLLAAMMMQAGELINYSDAYIWAQSGRNTSKKGSALATSTGKTYSLTNVISKTDPNDIDFLCVYGKTGKKGDKTFILFGPGNPTIAKFNWDKKEGTRPYCEMEATAGGEVDKDASLGGWDVRNETKIARATGVDFDNATYESIAALNPQGYLVNELEAGEVLMFETAATSKNPNKKGLIKILAIEDDPDRPERIGQGSYQKLLLDIKIQQ
ncbi:MAG: hypothetical protein LBR75_00215 [Prevotellaceae bacterium]|jgi:hypothetical protein|nr:hypothetical protein [Prevotellaceae bacterium]